MNMPEARSSVVPSTEKDKIAHQSSLEEENKNIPDIDITPLMSVLQQLLDDTSSNNKLKRSLVSALSSMLNQYLQKVQAQTEWQAIEQRASEIASNLPSHTKPFDQNHLWLKIKGQLSKVPVDDISWVTTYEKMIKFFVKGGTMVHNQTLRKFGAWISHPDLIQVHRKYIVNFQKIEKVDLKNNILWVMLNGTLNEIPISDNFKSGLLNRMQRPLTY